MTAPSRASAARNSSSSMAVRVWATLSTACITSGLIGEAGVVIERVIAERQLLA